MSDFDFETGGEQPHYQDFSGTEAGDRPDEMGDGDYGTGVDDLVDETDAVTSETYSEVYAGNRDRGIDPVLATENDSGEDDIEDKLPEGVDDQYDIDEIEKFANAGGHAGTETAGETTTRPESDSKTAETGDQPGDSERSAEYATYAAAQTDTNEDVENPEDDIDDGLPPDFDASEPTDKDEESEHANRPHEEEFVPLDGFYTSRHSRLTVDDQERTRREEFEKTNWREVVVETIKAIAEVAAEFKINPGDERSAAEQAADYRPPNVKNDPEPTTKVTPAEEKVTTAEADTKTDVSGATGPASETIDITKVIGGTEATADAGMNTDDIPGPADGNAVQPNGEAADTEIPAAMGATSTADTDTETDKQPYDPEQERLRNIIMVDGTELNGDETDDRITETLPPPTAATSPTDNNYQQPQPTIPVGPSAADQAMPGAEAANDSQTSTTGHESETVGAAAGADVREEQIIHESLGYQVKIGGQVDPTAPTVDADLVDDRGRVISDTPDSTPTAAETARNERAEQLKGFIGGVAQSIVETAVAAHGETRDTVSGSATGPVDASEGVVEGESATGTVSGMTASGTDPSSTSATTASTTQAPASTVSGGEEGPTGTTVSGGDPDQAPAGTQNNPATVNNDPNAAAPASDPATVGAAAGASANTAPGSNAAGNAAPNPANSDDGTANASPNTQAQTAPNTAASAPGSGDPNAANGGTASARARGTARPGGPKYTDTPNRPGGSTGPGYRRYTQRTAGGTKQPRRVQSPQERAAQYEKPITAGRVVAGLGTAGLTEVAKSIAAVGKPIKVGGANEVPSRSVVSRILKRSMISRRTFNVQVSDPRNPNRTTTVTVRVRSADAAQGAAQARIRVSQRRHHELRRQAAGRLI